MRSTFEDWHHRKKYFENSAFSLSRAVLILDRFVDFDVYEYVDFEYWSFFINLRKLLIDCIKLQYLAWN